MTPLDKPQDAGVRAGVIAIGVVILTTCVVVAVQPVAEVAVTVTV